MKIDCSDYIAITDSNIISVTPEGIHYTGGFISFLECVKNYKEEHGGSGKCVGERYAEDQPIIIVFQKKLLPAYFCSGKLKFPHTCSI